MWEWCVWYCRRQTRMLSYSEVHGPLWRIQDKRTSKLMNTNDLEQRMVKGKTKNAPAEHFIFLYKINPGSGSKRSTFSSTVRISQSVCQLEQFRSWWKWIEIAWRKDQAKEFQQNLLLSISLLNDQTSVLAFLTCIQCGAFLSLFGCKESKADSTMKGYRVADIHHS